MISYIALDTETRRGKALLLYSAERVWVIRNFFDFLEALKSFLKKRRRSCCFTFFNLDYDVTALLKHLKKQFVRELFLRGRACWGGVSMEYIPGKFWKIAWHGYTFFFYDLYPFFQCGLDAAGQRFLGETGRKARMSKRMLKGLSLLSYRKHRKKWDAYGMQDARILQSLTDQLISALRSIGYEGRNLYSPGYVAKRYLQMKGVGFGWLPPDIEKFISKCYYGANVEIYQRGFFPNAWSYDVKSAYPAAMSDLPDFEKASYSITRKPESKHYFAKVRVWMQEAPFYLLPMTSPSGVTIFPRFRGQIAWVCNEEVEALRENGDTVEILEVCNVFAGSQKPFAGVVEELFLKRREGGMKGLVYKLILNSMYGISAEKKQGYRKLSEFQTLRKLEKERRYLSDRQFLIGQALFCPKSKWYWMKECVCSICQDTRRVMYHAWKKGLPIVEFDGEFFSRREFPGRMRNLAIAAKITARTRVKMFAIKKCIPIEKLICCFTDGIKTLAPIELPEGAGGLGDLCLEIEKKPLLVIGCGVYQHGETVKLRGFHYKKSLIELLRRQSRYRRLRVPITTRLTGLELVHDAQAEFSELNVIADGEKFLDINFDTKRQWPRAWKNGGEVLGGSMTSKPLDFG